jgi:hypothetical protein
VSQFSGSVILDVELGRVGDVVAQRLLAKVQEAGLVEQVAQQLAAHLDSMPALCDQAVVACVDSWGAVQPGWYAFEFHAIQLGARLVLYAQSPDRYVPGVSYTLALSVTPTSDGDQPARATAPIPEPVAPLRDGQTADVRQHGLSWFGGDGDQ